jgi:outer membrane lipoprotein-sorting protein
MRKPMLLFFICSILGTTPPSAWAEPTPAEILARYDEIMNPRTFDGLMVMTAHRQDGTTRSYKMRVLKSDDEKVRVWFFEPASAKGQEMLRVEDNLWVFMPSLKRALRIASRESFQGGDFNNGDVLRANYLRDYSPVLAPSGDDGLIMLRLTAKTKDAAYDRISLWVTKADLMPARGEYYAASGKLLRSATFSDIRTFRGHRRPSHVVMRNELATKRYSELNTLDLKLNVEVPAQRFVLDDLGR